MLARLAWCPDAPTTSRLSPVCSPFSRQCAALFHALPMDSGTLPSPGHGQSAWPRQSCSGLFALKADSCAGAPCQRRIWRPCRHTWRATARVGSAVCVSDKIDPTLKGERPMTLASVRVSLLDSSYDYVIVGAGSAGCVVAHHLVDGTDATVLLLEAGGSGEGVASLSNPPQWVENLGSPYDWAYRYEPSPHVAGRSIPLALGKVLGGSGSINAMVWTRGHRADYDAWAEGGHAGCCPCSRSRRTGRTARANSAAPAARSASSGPGISTRWQPRSSTPAGPTAALPGRPERLRARGRRPHEPERQGRHALLPGGRIPPPSDGGSEPDGSDRGAGGQTDAHRHALHRRRAPAGRQAVFRRCVARDHPMTVKGKLWRAWQRGARDHRAPGA